MGNVSLKQHGARTRNARISEGQVQNTTSSTASLSSRSFDGIRSHYPYSAYSVSRPWSRVSRRRWKESTLTLPLEASKTAWPVLCIESCFLPEFPLTAGVREKEFHIEELISRGAYGKVFKAKRVDSDKLYALKELSKSQLIRDGLIKQVKDEVQIQRVCGHHPFIVSCPFHWQSRRRLYIVSDFIEGGELHRLCEIYGALPVAVVKILIAEIALALDFLHNVGVIYRDLKLENTLLDSWYNIQLVDFGLSKWLPYGSRTTTLCGTLHYMAVKMNARTQVFELTMEGRQVDEAVASIFHTVLFHRSLGKFLYNAEGSYSIGTIGYTDVDCDFIDFTYVCCTSPTLDRTVRREISGFSELLRGSDSSGTGQISLEFFQKKRNRWLFSPECTPWEVWTVRLELISLNSEDERQVCREKVGEMLTEKILYITEVMNRHDYLPKVPNQSDLDLIFDTSYEDVQPYLFKFNYSTTGPSTTTVGSTMKKLIRETLAM